MTSIRKRSLTISGHRTSVSLEDAFWDGLKELAAARDLTIAALVREIDEARGPAPLSSALRLTVLQFYQDQAQRVL
ncbi:MAG: ribbon-helix-helix domain-containing protein [Pseudomonadota bacterium]